MKIILLIFSSLVIFTFCISKYSSMKKEEKTQNEQFIKNITKTMNEDFADLNKPIVKKDYLLKSK